MGMGSRCSWIAMLAVVVASAACSDNIVEDGDAVGGSGGGGSGTLAGTGGGADGICDWLGDPTNCYRTFAEDVGAECGALGVGTAPQGNFSIREELITCILQTQNGAAYQGGQVLFDPPLDLTASIASQRFSFIRNDGTSCGSARFDSKYDFSIEVRPHDDLTGGTYEQQAATGANDLVVTCPDGDTSAFLEAEVDECPEYAAIVPHAEMDLDPDSAGTPGVVRLRVYYPPPAGALEGAEPYPVEYFECIIPPPS